MAAPVLVNVAAHRNLAGKQLDGASDRKTAAQRDKVLNGIV